MYLCVIGTLNKIKWGKNALISNGCYMLQTEKSVC